MWRIGNPCASGGMEADTATVEEQYGGSKKKKGRIIWSSHSTSGYISGEIENFVLRYLHPPHVFNSIIYNSQDMEITCVHQ